MKYPYIVNKNGVWYPAGTDVPEDTAKTVEKDLQYTKTEINRMTTSELQKLATENGVDDAKEINGSELKKILIEKFGL